jgi:hypothetical protein
MNRHPLELALETGDRAAIIAALQTADPNGSHSDAAAAADGLEPYTLGEAAAAARDMLSR